MLFPLHATQPDSGNAFASLKLIFPEIPCWEPRSTFLQHSTILKIVAPRADSAENPAKQTHLAPNTLGGLTLSQWTKSFPDWDTKLNKNTKPTAAYPFSSGWWKLTVHSPLVETYCTVSLYSQPPPKNWKVSQYPGGFQGNLMLSRNSGPRKSLVPGFLGIIMTAATLGFGINMNTKIFLKIKKRQARPMAARPQSDLGNEVPSAYRCTAWGLPAYPRTMHSSQDLLSTHYPPGLWEASFPRRLRHLIEGNGKKQVFSASQFPKDCTFACSVHEHMMSQLSKC